MTEQEWMSSEDPSAMLAYLTPGEKASVDPRRWASDRKLRLFACACLQASDRQKLKDWMRVGRYDYGDEGETIHSDDLAAVCRDWAVSCNDYDPPQSVKAALLREIIGNPFRPVKLLYECGRCRGHGCLDTRTGLGSDEGYQCHRCRGAGITGPGWRTPQVLSLATAAVEERGLSCETCRGHGRPGFPGAGAGAMTCLTCHGTGRIEDGTLDQLRLLVLADALEEAGCDSEELLRHLRGQERCTGCINSQPIVRGRLDERYTWEGVCCTCNGTGWMPLRGPHVRGCWAVDLILGNS